MDVLYCGFISFTELSSLCSLLSLMRPELLPGSGPALVVSDCIAHGADIQDCEVTHSHPSCTPQSTTMSLLPITSVNHHVAKSGVYFFSPHFTGTFSSIQLLKTPCFVKLPGFFGIKFPFLSSGLSFCLL